MKRREATAWLEEAIADECIASLPTLEEMSHAIVSEAKRSSVLLIMIDGLGYRQLQQYRSYGRTLWQLLEGKVGRSTVPSTTAAAISTLLTGNAPSDNRMLGYSVHFQNRRMSLLQFNNDRGLAAQWIAGATISERLARTHSAVAYLPERMHDSSFSAATLKQCRFRPRARVASDWVASSNQLRYFAYAYWPEIDKAGHTYGVGSERWLEALESVDFEVRQAIRGNPRAAVYVTADHGMVNLQPRNRWHLDSKIYGIEWFAGEPRCLYLKLCDSSAISKLRENIGNNALIIEVPDELGALAGDVAVVASDTCSYFTVDGMTEAEMNLAGAHGGVTADELLVPMGRIK